MIYFCDYKKNKECPKTHCLFIGNGMTGSACIGTTDVALAMRDMNGDPIVFDMKGKIENECGGDN